MAGVGEVVGRSFWNARQPGGDEPHVFHVLPEEFGAWDYGATLFAGDTLEERREVLARVSSIYVVIEGGPGTRQEARIARKNGAVLIPVARTGGCARRLHARLRCPVPGLEREWTELRAPGPTPADLARAVSAIVARLA